MNNHKQGNRSLPGPLPGKTGWPWTSAHEPLPETLPDGSPWPKISVVTPSFNQGQFIEEAIRSVLLQDYPNLEFIIIDGGSTDKTLEIIHKYEPWLAYWVSEPDCGQSHAINKGIRQATGEILLWLNSDDIVLPGTFFTVASKFSENAEVKMVIGQAQIININGDVIGELRSDFTSWEELATNPRNSVRQISSFFSRTLFDEYGLVNETLHISMDNELLLRFTKNHTPLILQDFLTAFRVQPNAKTFSQLKRGYEETDHFRLNTLTDMRLRKSYRIRSSINWLSLSENQGYSRSVRLGFLLRVFTIRPSIISEIVFWSTVKRIIWGD